MREALQRRRAKGGSAYVEGMEPASESCMNSMTLPILMFRVLSAVNSEVQRNGRVAFEKAMSWKKYSVHRR